MDFLIQQITALRSAVIKLSAELRTFRDSLTARIDDLSHALQEQSDSISEAGNAYKETQSNPPSLNATLQVLHPISVETEAKDRKAERAKKVVSILTLTFSIIYTAITGFIFWQTKKAADAAKESADAALGQLNLTQQQLVAVISFGQVGHGFDNSQLTVSLGNIGRVPSQGASVSIRITRCNLDLKETGKPLTYSERLSQVVVAPNAWEHRFTIDRMLPPYFVSQDYTYKVEETVDFDDGFGKQLHRSECEAWIGKINFQIGGELYGYGNFYNCSEYPDTVKLIRKYQAAAIPD